MAAQPCRRELRDFTSGANGFPQLLSAIPQSAIAQAGSAANVDWKPSIARPNSNECNSATARSNDACAFGEQDVARWTLPSAPPPGVIDRCWAAEGISKGIVSRKKAIVFRHALVIGPRIADAHLTQLKKRNWKTAPISAAPGIVSTHAHKIRRVTPQRTAVSRRDAPTPEIAPVITCVELTGIPAAAVPNSVIAAEVSAANPPNGVSFVIRWPIVFTTRQPPAIVPPAIASAQQTITQSGTL